MLLKRWQTVDPIRAEINRLQQQMSSWLVGQSSTSSRGDVVAFPALDMWREEGRIWLEVELPGVAEGELELLVTPENQLVISGGRKCLLPEGSRWKRRERQLGDFERRVTLPVEVDADQVSACLSNGILRVQLVEKQAAEPRRIEIETV